MRAAAGLASSSSSSRCSCCMQPGAACWPAAAAPAVQQWQRRSSSTASIASSRPRRVAAAAASGDAELSLEQRLAAELAARQEQQAKAAEVAAAAAFDGQALLALLRKKYGRSYDISLVSRTYLGKRFTALNIMWKYQEQQSFGYTPQEYEQRLNYVAAALVAWGSVTAVQTQLAATKDRPRVGKAVSIMLDVPEEQAREWIAW